MTDSTNLTQRLVEADHILQTARQCQALCDFLREELSAPQLDQREANLIGAASALARQLYAAYWETSGGFGSSLEAKLSGQLRAALETLQLSHAEIMTEADGSAREELLNRTGWLQSIASDIADQLVDEIRKQAISVAVECAA